MKLSSCLSGSLLVLLALSGTNCSTPVSAGPAASNNRQYYVVSARKAAFYRYGPQQASGPDEKLGQGTLVTLIRPTFGYSKVQLSNGLQGYVASQDIHTAPPEVVQAATNPNPPVTGTGQSSRQARFRSNVVDPRFLPPPPPLPEDQPEPTPIPGSELSPTP
jgi:uncharacterized protein YgiM (DUF1202 family)